MEDNETCRTQGNYISPVFWFIFIVGRDDHSTEETDVPPVLRFDVKDDEDGATEEHFGGGQWAGDLLQAKQGCQEWTRWCLGRGGDNSYAILAWTPRVVCRRRVSEEQIALSLWCVILNEYGLDLECCVIQFLSPTPLSVIRCFRTVWPTSTAAAAALLDPETLDFHADQVCRTAFRMPGFVSTLWWFGVSRIRVWMLTPAARQSSCLHSVMIWCLQDTCLNVSPVACSVNMWLKSWNSLTAFTLVTTATCDRGNDWGLITCDLFAP